MIIDVHSHIAEENRRDGNFWLQGEPDGPLPVERFMAHLAREPVDHVLLSSHPRADTPDGYRRCNDRTARAISSGLALADRSPKEILIRIMSPKLDKGCRCE